MEEEAGSDGESNRNMNQGPPSHGQKKPKRQMKTPFQFESLETTYSNEMYPSEATRAELSVKLGLTDRQLQMWFCHRRLKDKKERSGMTEMKPRSSNTVGKRGLMDSPRDEVLIADPGSENESGSGSGPGSDLESDSGSSQFENGEDMPMVPVRYFESPRTIMERRVIACVEAQLGEPLRDDGPMLGVEFDVLPPGAFGTPIVTSRHRDRYMHSYDKKSHGPYDAKQIKAAKSGLHEPGELKIRSDSYGQVPPAYLYESSVVGPTSKPLPLAEGNGHLSREYSGEGQVSSANPLSHQDRQGCLSSPLNEDAFTSNNDDIIQIEWKRKIDEARIETEVQANEKRTHKEVKELEKQDILNRKREEQAKKEMERLDRERRKEEQKIMREQQRQEERFQREEKREMERRERFMQKELLQAERKKQKEEMRREREAAKQKAAMERAAVRRIAKESLELIEDERLELMELAASSKGLPSIVSLDYDTLQNLETFRDSLCEFPPKSVKLKKPFAIQPWINSEDNVGNLLMAWRFCITFDDILGLWPFTLDEFIQAFHDYDSRLMGEIHIALLKLILKDIEDVARTPSGGPGTNQYGAVNPEGGHPHIVEEAYIWGFDIRTWQKHLNPLTWPEILRQFALSAGFGPQLKEKNAERVGLNDNDESKGCEDIVSTLLNGSAAENAVAIMQEKGFSLQRKNRHRLTPGTVKFAAYHVLALEGSKGLNVLDLSGKIQKSGLRDLTTSKTPEASISVALSRDQILFERIAPSTYCVRPAYRKDPADAETVISAAREKIQKYMNGFLVGQNAKDEERDDDSDCEAAEGPEIDDLVTPSDLYKNAERSKILTCSTNGKEGLLDDVAEIDGSDGAGASNADQGAEIDESKRGEPWVQGLTEGEYSDLSVEERLNALVSLVGVANEGNTVRVILEDRLDAANALKKQMWAEAQLDKRRMKEEFITKFNDSAHSAAAERSQSPLVVADNRNCQALLDALPKNDTVIQMSNADNLHPEKSSLAIDTTFGLPANVAHQNGYTAERSRLQMKAFIGHKAEEMYVYRSLPLGLDRRRNRYWLFVASPSSQDPGSGRIFVESPDGCWSLVDSEQACDALLLSLDVRGTRESHLHIMLQKIEVPFRELARKNLLGASVGGNNEMKMGYEVAESSSSAGSNSGTESPNSTVCGMSSDLFPSSSFKIELGRNDRERENALSRYQDLQIWMWKESFNSSVLRAMSYGKKQRTPLLGICNLCLDSFMIEDGYCHSCRTTTKLEDRESFLEQKYFEEKLRNEPMKTIVSNCTHPFRIRMMKALLSCLEASVLHDALQSSWTEDFRKTWALKLLNASGTEDLLQILTQFEGVIKRDYLSSDFETTEELLSYCSLSKGVAYNSSRPRVALQLPWIPQTSAAVALRLLELDASIYYNPHDKPEPGEEKKVENFIKLSSRYPHLDKLKVEPMELNQDKQPKEESWDYINSNAARSSKSKQVVRGRGGGGRPRVKLPKGAAGSASGSGKKKVKHSQSLSQVLMKQGEGTYGQKHKRGRRTVRKRRVGKKIVQETLTDHHLVYKPCATVAAGLTIKSSSGEKAVIPNNYEDMEDHSNSLELDDAMDSDENAPETTYEFGRWNVGFNVAPQRTGTDAMEMSDHEENVVPHTTGRGAVGMSDDDEDDDSLDENDRDNGGNLEEEVEMNDYESDRQGVDENSDEDDRSDSVVSGDYSD